MKYEKIMNLLDTRSNSVPRFNTKKRVEVNAECEKPYNFNNQIKFKISMLTSDICDYSDAYIVVEGTVTVQTEDNRAIDGYKKINA